MVNKSVRTRVNRVYGTYFGFETYASDFGNKQNSDSDSDKVVGYFKKCLVFTVRSISVFVKMLLRYKKKKKNV